MKNSCISYPEREPMVIIRKSQVEFCNGNLCAASLMSSFEYWHNIKLDMSPKNAQMNNIALTNGQTACHDESLYQFHTMEELSAGIMGLYKRDTIIKARKILKELNILTEHRNPSDRYKFDNTVYYLFNPQVFMDWLFTRYNVKTVYRQSENIRPESEIRRPTSENRQTITETTTETTTEIIKEKNIKKENPLNLLLNSGLSEDLAIEFIQLRKSKKALITQTVINGISKEAKKANITLSEAISHCIIRNWQSFKAEWIASTQESQKIKLEENKPRIPIYQSGKQEVKKVNNVEYFKDLEKRFGKRI